VPILPYFNFQQKAGFRNIFSFAVGKSKSSSPMKVFDPQQDTVITRMSRSTSAAETVASTDNEEEEDNFVSPTAAVRKSVSFRQIVTVSLIPTLLEYKAEQLGDELWWSWADLFEIRQEVGCELREYIIQNPKAGTMKASSALKLYLVEHCREIEPPSL